MNKVLYIEVDEEITSIIDRVRSAKEDQLALVVPAGAVLLSSVVNLKLLKKEASSREKEISIITTDRIGRNLASQVGLTVYQKIDQHLFARPEEPVVAKKSTRTGSTKKIIPERKASKEETWPTIGTEEETEKEQGPRLKTKQPMFREPIRKTGLKKEVIIIALVASTFLLAFVLFLVLPRADIGLVFKADKNEIKVEVSLDKALDKVDLLKQIVPAKAYDQTVEDKKTFQATGKKNVGDKATGTVTITNRTGEPQPLLPTTRLLSDKGILFRTARSVTVPAASVSVMGEIQSGQANVEVIADSGGEEGNVGPSHFTIPGLPGRENVVFADSRETFTGGTTRMAGVVTEDDIKNAKQAITDTIYQDVVSGISKNEAGKLIVLSELSKKDVINSDVSVKPDTEATDFEASGKIKVTILTFKESDFQDILSDRIGNLVSSGKQKVNGKDEISWSATKVDVDKGKANLTATVKYLVSSKIEPDEIRANVLAKTYKEANDYLYSLPNIDQAKIKLWPGFVKSVPTIERNIKISIEYKS